MSSSDLRRARARMLSTVLDCRGSLMGVTDGVSSAPARTVAVDAVLDSLSASQLADLRRANRTSTLAGRPHFRCPACHEPVYPAVGSVAASGVLGGERAYFKHHAKQTGTPDCPLARERSTSVDAVDAHRFGGLQEGAWHAWAKQSLGELCVAEPGVGAVFEETRLSRSEAWRQPDLIVQHQLGTVALEIQRASPQLDVVLGREGFYAPLGIGLMWIVDAEEPHRLERQGFQDAILPHGGVVHGWSPMAARRSVTDRRLHLHRLTLAERDDHFLVDDELVPFSDAVAEVMKQLARNSWPLAEDASARAFRMALLSGDQDAQQAAFERLRAELRLAATWDDACDDRLSAAVGATVTALTGAKGIASRFPANAPAVAIINNFVGTKSYRAWIPLLLQACEGHADADARLAHPSTARLISEALSEAATDLTHAVQVRQRWGTLFQRMFLAARRNT